MDSRVIKFRKQVREAVIKAACPDFIPGEMPPYEASNIVLDELISAAAQIACSRAGAGAGRGAIEPLRRLLMQSLVDHVSNLIEESN